MHTVRKTLSWALSRRVPGLRPDKQARCITGLQAVDVRACGASHILSLDENEVHLHWVFLDKIRDDNLQQFEQCLSSSELELVNSTPNKAAKRQKLLSRALTRSILPNYILHNCSAQDLELYKNEHGKPHISPKHFNGSATCDLDFNITHTSTILGCAVGRGLSVGLDVEETGRRPRNLLGLARRRFSAAEYSMLASIQDEEEQALRFLQLWTLKEAVVKARGTGISCPPGLGGFSIGLHLQNQLEQQLLDSCLMPLAEQPLRISLASGALPEGTEAYDLFLLQPSPTHIAALCVLRAQRTDCPTLRPAVAEPTTKQPFRGGHLASVALPADACPPAPRSDCPSLPAAAAEPAFSELSHGNRWVSVNGPVDACPSAGEHPSTTCPSWSPTAVSSCQQRASLFPSGSGDSGMNSSSSSSSGGGSWSDEFSCASSSSGSWSDEFSSASSSSGSWSDEFSSASSSSGSWSANRSSSSSFGWSDNSSSATTTNTSSSSSTSTTTTTTITTTTSKSGGTHHATPATRSIRSTPMSLKAFQVVECGQFQPMDEQCILIGHS